MADPNCYVTVGLHCGNNVTFLEVVAVRIGTVRAALIGIETCTRRGTVIEMLNSSVVARRALAVVLPHPKLWAVGKLSENLLLVRNFFPKCKIWG